MDAIPENARRHNLIVIEDATRRLMAEHGGRAAWIGSEISAP